MLVRVQAVQAAHILCDGSSPRHWKREEQRVQPRLVETFSDVTASGQQHTRLVVRHLCQGGHCGSDLLSAQAAPEGDYVRDGGRQMRRQDLQVLRALRQHQWKTTGLGCGDNVVTD